MKVQKMTDTTTIQKTVFFSASKEVVWAFLTEKDKMATWYHGPEADLASGQPYALHRIADDGARVKLVWGEVISMDQPNKLVTTFEIGPFEGRNTTVTWTLDDAAGGTRLTMSHAGIAEAAAAAAPEMLLALDKGWDDHIAKLRTATSSSS
jgi:uncharacterized protein YndB with AHSA1/START domain